MVQFVGRLQIGFETTSQIKPGDTSGSQRVEGIEFDDATGLVYVHVSATPYGEAAEVSRTWIVREWSHIETDRYVDEKRQAKRADPPQGSTVGY